jgi:hypothetical protein
MRNLAKRRIRFWPNAPALTAVCVTAALIALAALELKP